MLTSDGRFYIYICIYIYIYIYIYIHIFLLCPKWCLVTVRVKDRRGEAEVSQWTLEFLCLFLFGIHKLARQLHQERTQMEVQ